MVPTTRSLLLLLLPAPFLVAATWIPSLVWVAGTLALVVVALIVADWYLAQPPSMFQVKRTHGSRLSLGVENTVTLHVQHRHRPEVQFQIRDEPPWQFESSDTIQSGWVAAGKGWLGKYTVRPFRRGDYAFGDTYLRWLGPMGLAQRQGHFATAAPVKVYPDLLGVQRYDLLLRQNRLQEIGLRNARLTGQGTEFERLREYRPDDDFRRINWKATARRLRPITVAYQTERSQNIMVVLDTGRMMQSPVGRMAKLDYAINATLLLSYVAAGIGDKVGMLAFSSRVQQFLAPRQGRLQFYRMLELLYAVEPEPVEPDYHQALGYLARKQRRRSLIIIFTDVTGSSSMQALAQHLQLLVRHNLPLVVTISDPHLIAMAQHKPQNTAEMYERAVAGKLLAERRALLEGWRRQGIDTLDVPANHLSPAIVGRYLELKRKGRI